MKKRNYKILPALTLSLAMIGSMLSYSQPAYATEGSEVVALQEATAKDSSTSAVIGEYEYIYPSAEEVEANKNLKKVIDQWQQSGEFPEYFYDCTFYMEEYLCPVILLTDISEETKNDFIEKVGFSHEEWIFKEAEYSRRDLLEAKAQMEDEFKDDPRIEEITLAAVGYVDSARCSYPIDDKTIVVRPHVNMSVREKWVNVYTVNECTEEVKKYVTDKYGQEYQRKVSVDFKYDYVDEPVIEKNLLPGRDYERQYAIYDFRDFISEAQQNNCIIDEEGNVIEEDEYVITTLVGDADGNDKLDLNDAKMILKMALNIPVDNIYADPFFLRFSEDHLGVNLYDAQEVLKRALKIETDLIYVEPVDVYPIYKSMEAGRLDKPVEDKIIKGKEALMEYVRGLDNPELENYLTSINSTYLEDKSFLIHATPVYSQFEREIMLDGYDPVSWIFDVSTYYSIKELSGKNVMLTMVNDSHCDYEAKENNYYISIGVLKNAAKADYENIPRTVEKGIYKEWDEFVTANVSQEIKEGHYIIRNMEQQKEFNENIGNGFKLTKTEEYYERKLLMVNVTPYTGYKGDADVFNIEQEYVDPNRHVTISREKYLRHKPSDDANYKGYYVDVVEVFKDRELLRVPPYEWVEIENEVIVDNSMVYTYIDFAPQQQSFVTDYSKEGKLLEGTVRITTEEEKTEVLAFLEDNFADASLIESVEKADVSSKEYMIAFSGNKGTEKKTQEKEQMYVVFHLDSVEAYFEKDGSSFEPGKQVVTVMTLEKGSFRRQLEGNTLLNQ